MMMKHPICVITTMFLFYLSIAHRDRNEFIARVLFALAIAAAAFSVGAFREDIKHQTLEQLCQVKGISCTNEDGTEYHP